MNYNSILSSNQESGILKVQERNPLSYFLILEAYLTFQSKYKSLVIHPVAQFLSHNVIYLLDTSLGKSEEGWL